MTASTRLGSGDHCYEESLARAAFGTVPVRRQLLPRGAGRDTFFGYALGLVIDITADITQVCHRSLPLLVGWLAGQKRCRAVHRPPSSCQPMVPCPSGIRKYRSSAACPRPGVDEPSSTGWRLPCRTDSVVLLSCAGSCDCATEAGSPADRITGRLLSSPNS